MTLFIIIVNVDFLRNRALHTSWSSWQYGSHDPAVDKAKRLNRTCIIFLNDIQLNNVRACFITQILSGIDTVRSTDRGSCYTCT